MDYAAESLKLHYKWQGKIEVTLRAPLETADDLSLAYTPGVAEPCLEIQKDVNMSYELTRRSNLVAAAIWSQSSPTAPPFSDWATSDRKPACRSWRANVHCSSVSAM